MDFDWNTEQQDFRSTGRAFLEASLPANWEELAHGPGSEAQTLFSKEFCGALAKAGLLVPHWPARWGGRDADPWIAFILAEEMWAAGEPRGVAAADRQRRQGRKPGFDRQQRRTRCADSRHLICTSRSLLQIERAAESLPYPQ